MADLRIVDAPSKPTGDITGTEKIPTGGSGNYSVTIGSVAEFIKDFFDLASQSDVTTATNGVKALLDQHKEDVDNPHQVTKDQIGLGNVDNTADADKPMSNATQSAITTLDQKKADKTSVYLKTETYSKSEVDSALSNKPNSNTVYTKTQTDTLLNGKVSSVNGKTSIDVVLNREDIGVPSDIVMQQWEKEAKFVRDESGLTQQQLNNGIVDKSDLSSIPSPKNGNRVFVKSIQKWYTYNSSLSIPENGVTVIGKWEMDTQESYYASWFAQKEIQSDQSLKLQVAHDYVVSKGKTFIVDENFYVEANQTYQGIENNAFIVRDNARITFLPNGKFIQINQNKNQSNIILCMRNKNFTILKPRTVGDRLTNMSLGSHTSDAQGYGYGITLYEPENGYIFEPECSENHGDNIYIGKPWGSNQDILPKNITIVRPKCDHARRNCISLTSWNNVKIIDPVLSYGGDSNGITGAFPKCGIDVELENAPDFTLSQGYAGVITNPIFNNCTNGLFVYSSYNNRNFDIHVQGITTFNSVSIIGLGLFHGSANNTGLVKIDTLVYKSNMFQEIALAWNKLSKLIVEIDDVYPLQGDNSFEIASIKNGEFIGKTLGNVTINNIHTVGFTPFTCDIGADYDINGYKFYASKDATNGISYYTNNAPNQATARGSTTFIDSLDGFVHSGFSVSTSRMPNRIWQDPSVSPSDSIYINTSGDLRVLTIGLHYNTATIGNGCNINGLNLFIDGTAKTQAKTLTLGGWLKFQNMPSGRTKIIDSFGVWIFS